MSAEPQTQGGRRDLLDAMLGARVFDLEQPRRMHMPVHSVHWPGHVFGLHRRHEPGLERRTSAAGLITTPEHAGTHIDALCHQAEDLHMHGGVEVTAGVQTSAGFTALGFDTIEPIVTRGVLIDLPAARAAPLPPCAAVTADELRSAAESQGARVEPDSVALVRTGYGALWNEPERYLDAPGIDRSGSEWLADRGVLAVGADNVVWDLPDVTDRVIESTLPGHVVLLVRAGIYILENLYLEELASAPQAEFVFVCLPLKFEGGTGSPVRPIALVTPSS